MRVWRRSTPRQQSSPDSPLEGGGFEPSVPPRKRRPSREAPRPTIVVSRDDRCLITPSSLSVRRLSSATAERPFTRAGLMVRIHLPPAESPSNLAGNVTDARSRIWRTSCGNVWSSPAIDPRLRLVFFGTADGDPADRQLRPTVSKRILLASSVIPTPAGTAQQRFDPCNQLGHRVGAAGD